MSQPFPGSECESSCRRAARAHLWNPSPQNQRFESSEAPYANSNLQHYGLGDGEQPPPQVSPQVALVVVLEEPVVSGPPGPRAAREPDEQEQGVQVLVGAVRRAADDRRVLQQLQLDDAHPIEDKNSFSKGLLHIHSRTAYCICRTCDCNRCSAPPFYDTLGTVSNPTILLL